MPHFHSFGHLDVWLLQASAPNLPLEYCVFLSFFFSVSRVRRSRLSSNSNLSLLATHRCPGISDKGCGKLIAMWNNHPHCTVCPLNAPDLQHGVFAFPVCVDWPEELHWYFSWRKTYHKKSSLSLPSLEVEYSKPVVTPSLYLSAILFPWLQYFWCWISPTLSHS